MTHTAQEPGWLFWCHEWWASSSLMSGLFPAEAGYETWEQIFLLLVFFA